MKEIYLIAIVFLASQAAAYVIAGNESSTFKAENECPAANPCPPKLISYEKDCNHYYECKNQKKILKICKTGLYFSNKLQGCVKPENSECDCNDGGGPEDGEETECVNNGDLLPHECQCTKFYECKKKKKALHDCPLGQFFDKDKKTCVPGKNCKAVGTACEDGDLINHECQCNKYYLCVNCQKVLHECTEGYFDIDSSQCVKGTCPVHNKTCTQGEKKEHECNYKKYYACRDNDWIALECKKGQHFSPTEQKCIKGKADECNSTPKHTPTPTPSPGEPGECPEGAPTLWRHECDCRLYYECIEDKKQLQICAWGKYFDYVNQVCEEAKKVSLKCQNTWDDWLTK